VGIESPQDIISKSPIDLQRLLKINDISVNEILQAASKDVYDWRLRGTTGTELVQQETRQITTGDDMIDKVLNGGVSLGTVTEIVGER
jgi:RecA/RadA recombinase